MMRFFSSLIVLFALTAVLPACAQLQFGAELAKQGKRTAAGGIYKVGKPYKIAGEWYYPRENTKYDNIGIASWYGPKFQGRRTANGEIFDMNLLTAAHPTLPMPVMVQVTNLENGRSMKLRVNDRGPFKKNREIDLSRRAAEILGFKDKGTARVRVKYLHRAPLYNQRGQLISGDESDSFVFDKPYTPTRDRYVSAAPITEVETKSLDGQDLPSKKSVLPEQKYYVQLGVFSRKDSAEALRQKLGQIGQVEVSELTSGGRQLYRVRVGPVNSRVDANILVDDVLDNGHQDAFILEE
ncbi:Succinate-semialdehyde dehydrogenase NADP+ dependent PutA 2 protein [Candidatus Micropelagos thuwalensis]|uniref:Endolytic peptidoglycan transglycosylase RlpA n=1 Tax=Candidatus Micropelagius thuwalensis TaxID=1397666 RepID=U2WCV2_9PROT|nr:septal ring lytic transglycosylase RlpA family protein [Candidatus Micropelagos thuwalensis]ERL47354.1 Succinate-semialdehyde dehydrogenase NADP+ dependent PutA 2 protein [Candidatus Micropelagos thuwalensis]